ncbi:MAG: CBS domain-containing protein [Gammaproteobacteria bacterium]|nr:CBS domain-containing protein [Gammaproteobacteria bacterium]
MTDDQPTIDPRPKSWIDKLAQVFSDEPTDTSSLLELLRNAQEDRLLDIDTLGIIEGALQVSSLQVRDIMIPRSQVVTVAADHPLSEVMKTVCNASHSRFPVVSEDVDNVMGILLAKDLLKVFLGNNHSSFNLKGIMRPATMVPETKPLNILLKEFQENRQHMAVVLNEYGSVSGIVTIEDVLEEIVGEIEDEFDVTHNNINKINDQQYHVKAQTSIHEFNQHFETKYDDEDFTTFGGLLLDRFGHIPGIGETITIKPFHITVLNADSRQIIMLRVMIEQPLLSDTAEN